MARENWQKIKLLKLNELLRQETDEEHPLTTRQICDRMEQMDIPCDRRTLYRDIAVLNDHGVEVLSTWVGKSKAFYVDDRSFSVPELKILIDAVQAAECITEKKTSELVDKIANLGGSHRAEILKGNLVCFNTRKHTNESVYYNVDALERALREKKKVVFRYFDLDTESRRVYRRDGHHYVVEPVALVFIEDNYYLISYSARHDNTANYRVDRMDEADGIDEEISERALALRDGVWEYTEQAFKMYGGPMEEVTLEFGGNLIGAVYDRFGESTSMTSSEDGKVTATIRVQLSPTFWGWLFQFGKGMKILSPEYVVEERKARIAELAEG